MKVASHKNFRTASFSNPVVKDFALPIFSQHIKVYNLKTNKQTRNNNNNNLKCKVPGALKNKNNF